MSEPLFEEVPAQPSAEDFDTWLATGTMHRDHVTIYNDAALMDRAAELDEQLKEAEKAARATGGERSVGDTDPVAAIVAEMEALATQFDAGKVIFTLRPVVADDRDAIRDKFADAPAPRTLPPNAPESALKAYEKRLAEWRKTSTAMDLERNLAWVAASAESITLSDGRVLPGPTVEQLRALRARPHGEAQFNLLILKANNLTNGTVAIPRPTLPASSKSDQD
jgi:hypothetical protein